ncbi:conserved membrane hypothetical protein [Nitrolancea hollandica Lb]|uniref:Uncharacterized protein n=2 Tax=Nitrolancea hollandica TaxID=1206749 RepID=I4EK30_9BACT|nr:conserved membrane hypothetical protein [Nitrolancea hollandica Lb]
MMTGHAVRWTPFASIALGLWLITSPVTFGYRSPAMAWSDIISGLLVVIFAAVSVFPGRGWTQWANAVVGIWLLFAPLVFCAPDPAAYINDTLIGALVIAFSILIPGMPGMRMLPGPEVPPGWSYNPSSWFQRAPVIALGIVSFVIARYLAAFQLGYIDQVWDPFFGEGTRRALTSSVSHAWPVSDAGLGALAYLLEVLSGFMGDRLRWRTMPWMVLMFGVLVIPLGLTSIILVILQPVAVGTWCTLCLITALTMLIMIPLAVDEVVAMGQFLAQVHRERQPFWTNFWRGGTMVGGAAEEAITYQTPAREIIASVVRGVTLPWNLVVSALIGLWLMAAPAVLGARDLSAGNDYLVGPLITVVAVIAMAEVLRPGRYVNIILGLWLIAAPWFLAGANAATIWNDGIAGLALILLSLPLGPVRQRYGGWTQVARWTPGPIRRRSLAE